MTLQFWSCDRSFNDDLGDSVGQVLRTRITARIGEGQYSHGVDARTSVFKIERPRRMRKPTTGEPRNHTSQNYGGNCAEDDLTKDQTSGPISLGTSLSPPNSACCT